MPRPLSTLFVDFDSYFASVEQHLQPHLRGRPIGVVPVLAGSSSCIASSYEAKALGIKTGTRVADARKLCPEVDIVLSRPSEYVRFHHILFEQIESCIHIEEALSIDEVWCWLPYNWREREFVQQLGEEIQKRIAENVSEVITCSVGVGPNKWLAKMASKMNKPNGICIIEESDLPDCLYSLKLRDIYGVGSSMEARLHAHGVHSVYDLCNVSMSELRHAWGSVEGEFLWRQIRGEELPERVTHRSTFGHSHVLPPELRLPHLAEGVLHKLTQKAVLRMRHEGYVAGALQVHIRYVNRVSWGREVHFEHSDDQLFYARLTTKMWKHRDLAQVPVLKISVTLTKIKTHGNHTPSLFQEEAGEYGRVNKAIDEVIEKHGRHSLFFGGAMSAMKKEVAPMRISFGHVPDEKIEGDT